MTIEENLKQNRETALQTMYTIRKGEHNKPIPENKGMSMGGACNFITWTDIPDDLVSFFDPPCHGGAKTIERTTETPTRAFILSDFKVNTMYSAIGTQPKGLKYIKSIKSFHKTINEYITNEDESPFKDVLPYVEVLRDSEGHPRHFIMDMSTIEGAKAISFCQASRIGGVGSYTSLGAYQIWEAFKDELTLNEILYLSGFFNFTGYTSTILSLTSTHGRDYPFNGFLCSLNKIDRGEMTSNPNSVIKEYPVNINRVFYSTKNTLTWDNFTRIVSKIIKQHTRAEEPKANNTSVFKTSSTSVGYSVNDIKVDLADKKTTLKIFKDILEWNRETM